MDVNIISGLFHFFLHIYIILALYVDAISLLNNIALLSRHFPQSAKYN